MYCPWWVRRELAFILHEWILALHENSPYVIPKYLPILFYSQVSQCLLPSSLFYFPNIPSILKAPCVCSCGSIEKKYVFSLSLLKVLSFIAFSNAKAHLKISLIVWITKSLFYILVIVHLFALYLILYII